MTADAQTIAVETPLLLARGLNAFYGPLQALRNLTLEIRPGEIVTLIGANGAGKTTTLHALSRLIPLRSGEVLLSGARIDDLPSHRIVELGVAHVPERRRIFPQLTVLENLELGGYIVRSRREIAHRIAEALSLFPRLGERLTQAGGTLSGGEQQMLAVARALMQNPQLVFLDEPSMGLSPLFVEKIFEIIVEINKRGKAILLVEQNAHLALAISHRGYVLQNGEIVLEGPGRDLLSNEAVREAYLGGT
jgi:branched-chain amino acid transport system ATP-binding protein